MKDALGIQHVQMRKCYNKHKSNVVLCCAFDKGVLLILKKDSPLMGMLIYRNMIHIGVLKKTKKERRAIQIIWTVFSSKHFIHIIYIYMYISNSLKS